MTTIDIVHEFFRQDNCVIVIRRRYNPENLGKLINYVEYEPIAILSFREWNNENHCYHRLFGVWMSYGLNESEWLIVS